MLDKKILYILYATVVFSLPVPVFSQIDNERNGTDTNAAITKTFIMPLLSYKLYSFDEVQIHNVLAGITLFRYTPVDRENRLLSLSAVYSPDIVNGIDSIYSSGYHMAALTVNQRLSRHTINGAFIVMTDKPLYGGIHTFMGMAGYTYNLVKWEHFSMNLGIKLTLMDIGIALDNGVPWMLWPIPDISLSWDYAWFSVKIIPGLKLVIAPQKPFSLSAATGSDKFDVALSYNYFKDQNPTRELANVALGIKKDIKKVTTFDGLRYGISYYALYGSINLLHMLEISGGWAYDGKEGYDEIRWDELFSGDGFSKRSEYNTDIENGFYVSVLLHFML